MSDTNLAAQPQKMAKGLNFWIQEVNGLYCSIYAVKTKALISCAITAQLICTFFSHIEKVDFLMTQLIQKPTYEPRHEKTKVLVYDLVRHKPGCIATEDGWRLEILDLESRGIVLSM